MERIPTVGVLGQVGRFRPEQIEQQGTWMQVPNEERTTAAMTVVRMVPSNGSTETILNPMDVGEAEYRDNSNCYGDERTVPAGRRL